MARVSGGVADSVPNLALDTGNKIFISFGGDMTLEIDDVHSFSQYLTHLKDVQSGRNANTDFDYYAVYYENMDGDNRGSYHRYNRAHNLMIEVDGKPIRPYDASFGQIFHNLIFDANGVLLPEAQIQSNFSQIMLLGNCHGSSVIEELDSYLFSQLVDAGLPEQNARACMKCLTAYNMAARQTDLNAHMTMLNTASQIDPVGTGSLRPGAIQRRVYVNSCLRSDEILPFNPGSALTLNARGKDFLTGPGEGMLRTQTGVPSYGIAENSLTLYPRSYNGFFPIKGVQGDGFQVNDHLPHANTPRNKLLTADGRFALGKLDDFCGAFLDGEYMPDVLQNLTGEMVASDSWHNVDDIFLLTNEHYYFPQARVLNNYTNAVMLQVEQWETGNAPTVIQRIPNTQFRQVCGQLLFMPESERAAFLTTQNISFEPQELVELNQSIAAFQNANIRSGKVLSYKGAPVRPKSSMRELEKARATVCQTFGVDKSYLEDWTFLTGEGQEFVSAVSSDAPCFDPRFWVKDGAYCGFRQSFNSKENANRFVETLENTKPALRGHFSVSEIEEGFIVWCMADDAQMQSVFASYMQQPYHSVVGRGLNEILTQAENYARDVWMNPHIDDDLSRRLRRRYLELYPPERFPGRAQEAFCRAHVSLLLSPKSDFERVLKKCSSDPSWHMFADSFMNKNTIWKEFANVLDDYALSEDRSISADSYANSEKMVAADLNRFQARASAKGYTFNINPQLLYQQSNGTGGYLRKVLDTEYFENMRSSWKGVGTKNSEGYYETMELDLSIPRLKMLKRWCVILSRNIPVSLFK